MTAPFLVLAFVAIFGGSGAINVEVTITNGTLIGEKIDVDANGTIFQLDRFLGIPYAKPPVGSLRFRRPVLLGEKWSKPRQAISWPNNCVQRKMFADRYRNGNFTEDCLYLNVWSPDVKDSNLRPVLVWIHGGSFYIGGSSFDLYNGEMLSAKADAVIVTINYRVSTLGFLYSDEVTNIRGNQGMWDQAMALRWVKENIRQFGGDPDKITIMGESAGSQSVSLHILSPISRDLFANAIMMSGSALMKVVLKPEEMVKDFLFGIRQIGCAQVADRKISKKVVDCLMKMDPEKLDNVTHFIRNKIGLSNYYFFLHF